MPLTFFAHQAPVLPLKAWKPRWFDGTALCIGSMAPDFSYVFVDTPWEFAAHTFWAQAFWSVPFAAVATWLLRHVVAEPLGSHLRAPWGPQLRALARGRRPWLRMLVSAWLGGMSHIAFDGFTHRHGWAVVALPALRARLHLLGTEIATWKLVQYVGHVLGSALGLVLLVALVRAGKLGEWSGEPVCAPYRGGASLAFWAPVGLACGLGAASCGVVLASDGGIATAVIRGSCVVGIGVLYSCLRARGSVQG